MQANVWLDKLDEAEAKLKRQQEQEAKRKNASKRISN